MSSRPRYSVNKSTALEATIMPVQASNNSAWYSAIRIFASTTNRTDSKVVKASAPVTRTLKN